MAKREWHISEGILDEKAKVAIESIESFFHSLGIQTTLAEYTKDYKGCAELISDRFTKRGRRGPGERRKLAPKDVEEIVKMSY